MTHLEYLVSYGLAGDFGRFRANSPLFLRRGQRVIVRTLRGEEMGQVLRLASERHARWMPNTSVGTLLRTATKEDEVQSIRLADRAGEILARGMQLIDELDLPVALLDVEVFSEGQAVLHQVRWQECDVRDLVRALSSEFALTITLASLGEPIPEEHGCGSCGSEGGCGSCGSGGCGSCGVSNQEEVRAHFTELRERMERRVPLL